MTYPTEDAYMAACRALHWRTEELRQAGIEPLDLHKIGGFWWPDGQMPHYPPDWFRFPVKEAFPGDDHRQIYHAWRRYPRAVRSFGLVSFMLGLVLGVLPWVLR